MAPALLAGAQPSQHWQQWQLACTHCDAARASRRRNTAAGRRTEQACSARQRRVGGPERACGARQRRVGRPERKVCTRQQWVGNPSAPAAQDSGGSAGPREPAAARRWVGPGRARRTPVTPHGVTAPRANSRRRRRAGAEAGESESAALRRGPVGGPNALGVPPRRAVGGREAHEGWVRRRRIQSKKARFGLEARQLTATHALKSRRAWDHTLKSGPPEFFFSTPPGPHKLNQETWRMHARPGLSHAGRALFGRPRSKRAF